MKKHSGVKELSFEHTNVCQWYLQLQYPVVTNFMCFASELKIAHVGNQGMRNGMACVLQWSGM